MDGSWSPPPKRRSLRAPVNIPVSIERSATHHSGRAVNLGFGGAFVDAQVPLTYAEEVTLWMPILDPAHPSGVRSLVRWSSGGGFGVQFLELGAKEAHAISQLMGSSNEDYRLKLTNLEAELLVGDSGGSRF